ncbi:hypothetical protein C8R45DRAFT_772423, partial [Mycena sanguinolenta]
GVFGEVSIYYGVVEAQGHGRLHIHLLIWLKNGLSPLQLREHMENPDFKKIVFKWYDDVFCQNLPENSSPFTQLDGMYLRQPVMSRPLDPRKANFEQQFTQDLRDVLESTAQIHTHSDTCFKYLPKTLRNNRDNDKDCRFQLPRDTVEETYINEEGSIVLRCTDGRVNTYNPIIVATERCNMDIKPIGSGTVAMAMFHYVGNYTIKSSMDTAFIFSDIDGSVDPSERSRLLMVKTVNQLIGKRELSSQQMASKLMGWPSKYTNRSYPIFYWS